jgi:hypothetical protein
MKTRRMKHWPNIDNATQIWFVDGNREFYLRVNCEQI